MQVFHVNGLVPAYTRDRWLAAAAARIGGDSRFDAASGRFRARYDAAESAFTTLALTYIDKQVYATLVPPLKARLFIPTQVKGNPGDETYKWHLLTRTGVARLLAPGAALDLPRANVFQTEIYQRFYGIGVKVVYSYFELLAIGAALANGQPFDLVAESMRAALEAIEKKLDLIAAFGTASVITTGGFGLEVEADVGITGLLNNANATAYTVATGAAGGTAWSTKTPDEVLADLNGIVGGQVASTYEVHRPDTLIVPISQFETQLQRRMSDVSGETILSFFLRTRREAGHQIDVIPWQYATGAGAGSIDVMCAYKRDPRMLEHVLAMDATPLAPSTQGLETEQDVVAKTAGLVLHYPLSVSLSSGGSI